MTETIDQNRFPRGMLPINLSHVVVPGGADGIEYVICKANEHPRMILVSGQATSLAYANATMDIIIEDAAENPAAIVTASATVYTPVDITLGQYRIFEADEAVVLEVDDDGDPANSVLVTLQFVNIP